MSTVDAEAGEIHVRIVYYGPGLAGRTSNMQYVFHRTPRENRTPMVSVATERERTLSFSLVPRTVPPVRGLLLRLHLCTVPGAIFYDASRKLLLKDADAVIFVVDSQVERLQANVECLENLAANLALDGRAIASVPLVLQYNKRDLPSAMPVAELDAALNPREVPRFDAVATRGDGVFDSLRAATGLIRGRLEREG